MGAQGDPAGGAGCAARGSGEAPKGGGDPQVLPTLDSQPPTHPNPTGVPRRRFGQRQRQAASPRRRETGRRVTPADARTSTEGEVHT